MNIRPISASLLSLAGFLIMAMGIYFIFFRPALLPEDLRYIGSSIGEIQKSISGLGAWLHKVFWVMGGYILTSGILTTYIAQTSFRKRIPGAFILVLISGITSVGLMTVVNFSLESDFKWVLLSLALTWFIALILYFFRK